MVRSVAEILREYGPFPGVDHIEVTFDGQHVWFASGDKLNALDPASGKTVRSIGVAADAYRDRKIHQERLEMPPGAGVSRFEADGDQFFCGGGRSGKVRAVRRPRRVSAAGGGLRDPCRPHEQYRRQGGHLSPTRGSACPRHGRRDCRMACRSSPPQRLGRKELRRICLTTACGRIAAAAHDAADAPIPVNRENNRESCRFSRSAAVRLSKTVLICQWVASEFP